MEAYTDRLIVTDVEVVKGQGGIYGVGKSPIFKRAKVLSAGKSPNGTDNLELIGKEILFPASTEPILLPMEKNKFLMRRTQIEVIL